MLLLKGFPPVGFNTIPQPAVTSHLWQRPHLPSPCLLGWAAAKALERLLRMRSLYGSHTRS